MRKTKGLTIILILVLFFISNSYSSSIEVGGNIYSDVTWNKTLADTVKVTSELTVDNGITLNIGPGVLVEFQGFYRLNIQGRILAQGVAGDSIKFYAINSDTGWNSIWFDNTPETNDSSCISYSILTGGKTKLSGNDISQEERSGGAIHCDSTSKLRINNCLIKDNFASFQGGGIYCNSSSPLILNNAIKDNRSSGGGASGGGIGCYSSSSPRIANNIIENNKSQSTMSGSGGGIYCDSSSPLITNNVVTNNYAVTGSGIYCKYSSSLITNNIITGNTGWAGIGIYCGWSSSTIINNVIKNNHTLNGMSNHGGGILSTRSSLSILNNTIVNNIATGRSALGGGIYSDSSFLSISNTIIWGNKADTAGNQVYIKDGNSVLDFHNCDIHGDSADFGFGTGVSFTGEYLNNIDAYPNFTDSLNGNYSIPFSSPCTDIGTIDTSGLNLPLMDLANKPRISRHRIDIGAFEYQNSAPVVSGGQTFTVIEDSALTITLDSISASDIENDSLGLVIASGDNYTLSGTTIIPAPNFSGTLIAPVSVTDGFANSNVVNILVTVTPVNDVPVLTAAVPQTINEDTQITLTTAMISAADSDGDSLTVVVDSGANYTVSGTTVIPDANFNGTLTVPLSVNDGLATSNTMNMTITVTPVNDIPVLDSVTAQVTNEDTPITLTAAMVTASDIDADSLTLVIKPGVNYTAAGAILTPALNFSGVLTVPVTVHDGTAESNMMNMYLTVSPVNDIPVITATVPQTINEDGSITITTAMVTASDVDLDPLTMIIDTGANYTVTGTVVTPVSNFFGILTVPVIMSDGAALSAPVPLIVTVTPVNDTPVVITPVNDTIQADSLYTKQIVGSDIDSADTLTWRLAKAPFGMTIDSLTGIISWIPAKTQLGLDTVTISVIDKGGAVAVSTYFLSIFRIVHKVNGDNDIPDIVVQNEYPVKEEKYTAYPNPANSLSRQIGIKLTDIKSKHVSIMIFDCTGSRIYSKNHRLRSENETIYWDLRNRSGKPVGPGSYLAFIRDGKKSPKKVMIGVK